MGTGKNRPMAERGKPKQNSSAAFSTIFRISKFFHRSKQNLYFYFYCLKIIGALTENTVRTDKILLEAF
jgi:hypothetical protein